MTIAPEPEGVLGSGVMPTFQLSTADYIVKCVDRPEPNAGIEFLRLRDTKGKEKCFSREEVIKLIEEKKVVLVPNPKKPGEGAKVETVEVEDETWLKTVPNNKPEDNLENAPDCEGEDRCLSQAQLAKRVADRFTKRR